MRIQGDLQWHLHEFVPTEQDDIDDLAVKMMMKAEEVQEVCDSLHEFNPMMGHRGCRLAVTYPEIGGEYMYIEKVKEEYTKHTRTVTYKDSNGEERKKKETYWTWDKKGSEDKKCQEIKFCGIIFSSNKINIPSTVYIDTIKESSHIRYKYYASDRPI